MMSDGDWLRLADEPVMAKLGDGKDDGVLRFGHSGTLFKDQATGSWPDPGSRDHVSCSRPTVVRLDALRQCVR
jgi:hypothetical protein